MFSILLKKAKHHATISLTEPRQFYLIGLFISVIGLFSIIIEPYISYFLFGASLFLFCWAYLIEIIRYIKKIWMYDINKKLIPAIAGIAITLPCYISANQITNNITGEDPSNFDSSIAVLSILLLPKIILITGICVFFLATILHFVFVLKEMLFDTIKSFSFMLLFNRIRKRELGFEPMFARIFASGVFIFIFTTLFSIYEENKGNYLPVFENIIIQTDYYEKSPCKNTPKNSRIAFLNDGRVSVATTTKPFHWSFYSQKCNQ